MLRRILETWGDLLSLKLLWKTHKENKSNNKWFTKEGNVKPKPIEASNIDGEQKSYDNVASTSYGSQ